MDSNEQLHPFYHIKRSVCYEKIQSPQSRLATRISCMCLAFPDQAMKYSDTLTAIIDRMPEQFKLTPREQEILTLVLQGCNDNEIAAYMGVSKNRVQHGVNSIIGEKMLRSGGRYGIMLYLLEELDHEVMNAEKRINDELTRRNLA